MVKILAAIGVLGIAVLLFPRRARAGEPVTTLLEDLTTVSNANPTDTRPRGIRNNNPTNIEDSSIPWRGRIGNDGRYVVFDTPINGLRAGYLEIYDSIVRDGDNTIRKLIAQWAPPTENLTGAYQMSVKNQTGLASIDTILSYPRDAKALLRAIVRHENGQDPYTNSQYDDAYRAAGKS